MTRTFTNSHPRFSDDSSHRECSTRAADLFSLYDGRYPLLWEVIDFRLDRLKAIYKFFCSLRSLLQDSKEEFRKHLHERLAKRWLGQELPTLDTFKEDVIQLSVQQITCFQELEEIEDLRTPAFILFASGSLATYSGIPRQLANCESKEDTLLAANGNPEKLFAPDSPAFFYWAEFALLAIEYKCNELEWMSILPHLFRAERIYALSFGQPVDNQIPMHTRFSTYDADNFHAMDVADICNILLQTDLTYLQLVDEAKNCIRFAFPGGVD